MGNKCAVLEWSWRLEPKSFCLATVTVGLFLEISETLLHPGVSLPTQEELENVCVPRCRTKEDWIMRKASILFAFLLFACALASTQDENFDKVHIKVTKVSGNVYMLEGEGGNIGASVGDDGIVLIDDQYAPLAEKIQAALKGITDKPVRFIINTHYHTDHTDGNAYFSL